MIISITGTPGTGKTAVAGRLAKKLKMKLVSLNDFAKEHGFVTGRDMKRGSYIVDTKALSKARLPDDTVIEGHLSHFLKSDIIIVLRCDPGTLYKRLKKRGWSKDKIRENLEAECLGLIVAEAMKKGNNVYEIDASGTINGTLSAAMDAIKGKRNKYKPKIDYLEKITELDRIIK